MQVSAEGKMLLSALETPVTSGSHNNLTAQADYKPAASMVLDRIHEVILCWDMFMILDNPAENFKQMINLRMNIHYFSQDNLLYQISTQV